MSLNFRLIFLLFFLNLLAQSQNLSPNFQLARENTISILTSRYNSKEVNPYWIDETSFIYILGDNKNKYVLTLVNSIKKEKHSYDIELIKYDQSKFGFNFKNTAYFYNSHSGEITKQKPREDINMQIGNQNKSSVFVKSHNIYIKNPGSDKIEQISSDGEVYYSFKSNIDYNYTNENLYDDTLTKEPNILWSSNNDYFLAFRTDARQVNDNWVINSIANPRPELTTYKQRNPGDSYPNDEIWIYKTYDKTFRKTNLKKWENESYWFLEWSKYYEAAFILRINREQNKCDILLLDKNGKYKVVIKERPKANIYFPLEFKEIGKDKYLWFSRRDGWGHLYLINSSNKTIQQLTKGLYTVEKVIEIDSVANQLIFSAFGKEKHINPYYRFYYSLDLKTKEVKLLTPENANHLTKFSPDLRYFIDTYSRVDLAPKSILRNREGSYLLALERADTSSLYANGWKNPEIFQVKAADSITDLWGIMWKPFDFNPDNRYPIITFVYPGPQDNFVPVNFFERLNNAHLAQYGFIVVMCDTRGSSYKRSKKFSEYFRTNLRDYPLADNKFMIEQLMEKYSFIDRDLVGIWGGSSGGFMAASAILKYPDFYKVSVSRAGQHDPEIFHAWWSDIFNTPVNQTTSDTLYSNLSLAKNLTGKLFIIHGENDLNVHPANSARLANELMKNGKYFDYLVVPGGGHGWSKNGKYVQKRIWLYFIENLMGYKIEDVNIMDY